MTPEAFKTQEWLEAAKSGEPLGIRLLIAKGNATKVSDNFDEWYYNQIGLARYGISAWELTGEILVAGSKRYDIDRFAAPLNISAKYPGSLDTYAVDTANLEMYVFNEQKEKWDELGGTVDEENRLITFNTSVPGLFTILSNKESSQGFTDIKGHWAESDIQSMVQKKVISVGAEKLFFPNREITRAEFAVFLVKTLGLENTIGAKTFHDVGVNQPYYKEVTAAANSGIVAGVSEDKFLPDAQITRQEIAVMMARALKSRGKEGMVNRDLLGQFKDQTQIASWAMDSCAQVVGAGLMSGRSNSMFEPKSYTSRAEALVLLHRLINKLDG
jgi:hypothetical protein